MRTKFNLANAHPLKLQLPELDAAKRSLRSAISDVDSLTSPEREGDFIRLFSEATGESLPHDVILLYSASLAIDAAAFSLSRLGRRSVGVVSPIFDCIPDLLRRSGLSTQPVEETSVFRPGSRSAFSGLDALFVAIPNNPTGFECDEVQLAELAEWCAASDVALLVDLSLRVFGRVASWDPHQVLRGTRGLSYCIIDDTGKVWSLGELKLGMLSSSSDLQGISQVVAEELLLSVPSLTVLALTGMLTETLRLRSVGAIDGIQFARGVIEENRRTLRAALGEIGVVPVHSDASLSFEWLRGVGKVGAELVCDKLLTRSIGVLPGEPFFWPDPQLGRDMMRVALLRPVDWFTSAAEALTENLGQILR